MSLRLIAAAAKLQLRLVRRDIETISPLFTMPLSTVVSMAIFVESGRKRARYCGYCPSRRARRFTASFLLISFGEVLAEHPPSTRCTSASRAFGE